jgi:hypothetical protein
MAAAEFRTLGMTGWVNRAGQSAASIDAHS